MFAQTHSSWDKSPAITSAIVLLMKASLGLLKHRRGQILVEVFASLLICFRSCTRKFCNICWAINLAYSTFKIKTINTCFSLSCPLRAWHKRQVGNPQLGPSCCIVMECEPASCLKLFPSKRVLVQPHWLHDSSFTGFVFCLSKSYWIPFSSGYVKTTTLIPRRIC